MAENLRRYPPLLCPAPVNIFSQSIITFSILFSLSSKSQALQFHFLSFLLSFHLHFQKFLNETLTVTVLLHQALHHGPPLPDAALTGPLPPREEARPGPIRDDVFMYPQTNQPTVRLQIHSQTEAHLPRGLRRCVAGNSDHAPLVRAPQRRAD